ncbi:hypothetical protein MPLSOD_410048 [Mesorhizobium sp. SOD10]|nr:hypothetical protein MPLSOD_410048 [Mesorhizobium sp. SOD10]
MHFHSRPFPKPAGYTTTADPRSQRNWASRRWTVVDRALFTRTSLPREPGAAYSISSAAGLARTKWVKGPSDRIISILSDMRPLQLAGPLNLTRNVVSSTSTLQAP